MSVPVEISLEMYAEKAVVLPFFTGYVARGLLLYVVRQVDPSASGLLHELTASKPYSVAPLRFGAKAALRVVMFWIRCFLVGSVSDF
jgi:hypothetical protein